MGDYLYSRVGPRLLSRKRETEESNTERGHPEKTQRAIAGFDDRKGVIAQGIREASRNWKRKENNFPPRALGRNAAQ